MLKNGCTILWENVFSGFFVQANWKITRKVNYILNFFSLVGADHEIRTIGLMEIFWFAGYIFFEVKWLIKRL